MPSQLRIWACAARKTTANLAQVVNKVSVRWLHPDCVGDHFLARLRVGDVRSLTKILPGIPIVALGSSALSVGIYPYLMPKDKWLALVDEFKKAVIIWNRPAVALDETF